jgi:hypothetical protein
MKGDGVFASRNDFAEYKKYDSKIESFLKYVIHLTKTAFVNIFN